MSPTVPLQALWNRYRWAIDNAYPASPSAASLYRIGFALYLLANRAMPRLTWMSAYPDEFYRPNPGLPAIWFGVLPTWALAALEIGLVAAIVALLVGWRTVWSSYAVGVGGLLVNSVYFSFGKIEHTVLIWLIPLVFARCGWGSALSLDARAGRAEAVRPVAVARAIFISGVLVAVSFFTAAVPKIGGGWLSLDQSATLSHLLALSDQLGRTRLLAGTARSLDVPLLWELADWLTVAFEGAMAVSLLWPVWQRRLILIAWLFHLSVLLTMNIGFVGPIPVYPIYFIPLIPADAAQRIGRWVTRTLGSRSGPAILVGLAVAMGVVTLVSNGVWIAITEDLLGFEPIQRDLALFLIGLVVLVVVAAFTGGYRSDGAGRRRRHLSLEV